MVGKLQPLVSNQMIVGPDGKPTEYFIRWAQQRQIDIGAAIDAAEALQIVQDFIDQFELQEGSGIGIMPGGKLTSNPTISADAQAILDQISPVHGTVLFRGAADWQGLAPGTAGQFLQTAGAGADPVWAAAGGGGGGADWTQAVNWTHPGTPASFFDFLLPSSYQDLLIVALNIATSTTSSKRIAASVDNGVSFFTTSGNYRDITTTGVLTNTDALLSTGATSAERSLVGHMPGAGTTGLVNRAVISATNTARIFAASSAPINALRLFGTAGNITGGTLSVFTR